MTAVRRRATELVVLMLAIAWFGVLAPGHRRGQVRLPGTNALVTTSYCRADRSGLPRSCRSDALNAGSGEPASKRQDLPADDCAVCQIIVTLQAPPVFEFGAVVVDLVFLTQSWVPLRRHHLQTTWTQPQRGPPQYHGVV